MVIDADAQGSLTQCLGYQQPEELEITLSTIMECVMQEKENSDSYGILHHAEGIDLLPCNIELSGLEVSLINAMSRELILRQYIEQIRDQYDYILIDCMPSLGMITINALAAADSVLIPVLAEYLPIKGLEQLIGTISRVKKYINPKIAFEGILISMVNERYVYARKIMEAVQENYGDMVKVYDTKIPRSTRGSEISAAGASVFSVYPDHKIATAYAELVEEFLANQKKGGEEHE